jgi:copper homeostasis protein
MDECMAQQTQKPLLEVCVDSMASALAAQEGGADRIELCASLLEGGLTPSAATIEVTRRHLSIGIQVMIRPRGGDFLYSDIEFEVMQRDIALAKELGCDGVVFGILNADGTIDRERTRKLVEIARPLTVTFHRAFDMVVDPQTALETLIDLSVDRVLTSGQEVNAAQGVQQLAALVKQARGRITIMPGGGITQDNIAYVATHSGASEYHMSGRVPIESAMRFRNERVHVSSGATGQEFSHYVTSADVIRASVDALRKTII